jgi:hypothetical protein
MDIEGLKRIIDQLLHQSNQSSFDSEVGTYSKGLYDGEIIDYEIVKGMLNDLQ